MLGLSLSMSPRLTQRTRLSVTQSIGLKQTILQHRFELTGAVHGGNYKPRAKCPKCAQSLTPPEIIQGFCDDPHDYTTACPACHTRFEPQLEWREGNSVNYAELPFYCSMQVLAQLETLRLQKLTPEEIQKNHPAIYHSVRIHHGSLSRAFRKIGIQYAEEQITNWREKVRAFLGKLPDTVIAEVVDLPVRTIRNLRASLKIAPFSKRALAEAEG